MNTLDHFLLATLYEFSIHLKNSRGFSGFLGIFWRIPRFYEFQKEFIYNRYFF